MMARSHEIVAMYEVHMFDGTPKTEIAGFFDNIFVPILTFVGVILFVYGFPKK